MNNEPSYHDLNTDPETRINTMINSYEKRAKKTLYPASPERLLILWLAELFVQARINQNLESKQNLPRYARGERLDELADLFSGVKRSHAAPAVTTIRFYISGILPGAQLIPKDTRISTGSTIYFSTIEDAYIAAGELYVDTTAVCSVAGVVGNGFVPGQISKLIDIYPHYARCENITTSEGGAERENDAELYEQMRRSGDAISTAGALGSYVYWAMSVSNSIADVRANSPLPAEVNVYVLMKGGVLPGLDILDKVADTLSASKIRPLTDFVTVYAPDIVLYDIDLTYYISSDNTSSAETIEKAINEAVDDYIEWQCEKMGRDINPDELISRARQAGAKRIDLRYPIYTPVNNGKDKNPVEVAVLQNKTVLSGGYEDE